MGVFLISKQKTLKTIRRAKVRSYHLKCFFCHFLQSITKGSDRITNAVALSANCYQRCHRSNDRDEFTAGLYSTIGRLIQE